MLPVGKLRGESDRGQRGRGPVDAHDDAGARVPRFARNDDHGALQLGGQLGHPGAVHRVFGDSLRLCGDHQQLRAVHAVSGCFRLGPDGRGGQQARRDGQLRRHLPRIGDIVGKPCFRITPRVILVGRRLAVPVRIHDVHEFHVEQLWPGVVKGPIQCEACARLCAQGHNDTVVHDELLLCGNIATLFSLWPPGQSTGRVKGPLFGRTERPYLADRPNQTYPTSGRPTAASSAFAR